MSSYSKNKFIQKRKELKLCIDCGTQDERTLKGHLRCVQCQQKQNEFQTQRYREKTKDVREQREREKAEKERKEHKNQYSRELYAWYKSRGICVDCGQEYSRTGRTLCEACAKKRTERWAKNKDKANEKKRKRTQDRIVAGLCTRCGKRKPIEGHRMCPRCNEMAYDSCRKYEWKKRKEKQVSWAK